MMTESSPSPQLVTRLIDEPKRDAQASTRDVLLWAGISAAFVLPMTLVPYILLHRRLSSISRRQENIFSLVNNIQAATSRRHSILSKRLDDTIASLPHQITELEAGSSLIRERLEALHKEIQTQRAWNEDALQSSSSTAAHDLQEIRRLLTDSNSSFLELKGELERSQSSHERKVLQQVQLMRETQTNAQLWETKALNELGSSVGNSFANVAQFMEHFEQNFPSSGDLDSIGRIERLRTAALKMIRSSASGLAQPPPSHTPSPSSKPGSDVAANHDESK